MHVAGLFTIDGGIEQGHGYPLCQGKNLEFYPKSKVLPLPKVCQDCIG